MSDKTSQSQPTITWWITSLAISVTCCAILFVFFAGYLSAIKKDLVNENMQLEQMAVRQDKLLLEIQLLQKTVSNNQASAVSAPAAASSNITVPAAMDAGASAPVVAQPVANPAAVMPAEPVKH